MGRLEKELKKERKLGLVQQIVLKTISTAGLITLKKTSQGKFARLTSKGKELLTKVEENNYQLEKPKRWDKKWRMIVFDISEKRKKVRDQLRRTLVSIGFVHMQHSVWVYPYDCEDLINLLKADFMIGKDVLYVIADRIENDKWLREYFNLPAAR